MLHAFYMRANKIPPGMWLDLVTALGGITPLAIRLGGLHPATISRYANGISPVPQLVLRECYRIAVEYNLPLGPGEPMLREVAGGKPRC